MNFDYTTLNIMRDDGLWLCPSCGFPGIFYGGSFDANGPLIGTGICPCCLYEPGFDDIAAASGVADGEPLEALRAYAKAWENAGMVWRGAMSARPHDWDPRRQLLILRQLAPNTL